jgi:hypothetical protein
MLNKVLSLRFCHSTVTNIEYCILYFYIHLIEVSHLFCCIVIVAKKPEGLDFHNRGSSTGECRRNATTNKHCLQGRTCDDKNPALQADVEGGTSSASCASLACYEDKVLRAAGENVIAATFFAR